MRKSSASTTAPLSAKGWSIAALLVRSFIVQAPPCTSTSAGNGPAPFGRYSRARIGLPSCRWYSTSSAVTSTLSAIASAPSVEARHLDRPAVRVGRLAILDRGDGVIESLGQRPHLAVRHLDALTAIA